LGISAVVDNILDMKMNAIQFWKTLPSVTRFIVLFIATLIIVSVVFSRLFTRFHDNLLWLMEATASISGSILALFADDVSRSGTLLTYKGFSMEIIDECTGLFEMLIYIAAVFSYPATFRQKLKGLGLGLPAIFIFNIARIIFLMAAGAYSVALFNFMHLYFWQATLIIMIAGIWVVWLYMTVYKTKGSKK
jgi:archaeosortase B (VPXXXP-CTERM-specific)